MTNQSITIMTTKYGYYSREQEKHIQKLFVYTDVSGKFIRLTEVSNMNPNEHGEQSNFNDIVFMGEIGKYVKTIELNSIQLNHQGIL